MAMSGFYERAPQVEGGIVGLELTGIIRFQGSGKGRMKLPRGIGREACYQYAG